MSPYQKRHQPLTPDSRLPPGGRAGARAAPQRCCGPEWPPGWPAPSSTRPHPTRHGLGRGGADRRQGVRQRRGGKPCPHYLGNPGASARCRGHRTLAAVRRAPPRRRRVLELRALCNLSSLELDAGNLAKARAVAVDAAELAERAGLSSSVYGIEALIVGSIAHYQAGEPQRNASPAGRNSAATTLGSRSRPAAVRPISPAGRATWIGRVRSFERPQKSTGRPAGAGDST
jgi:hypothetical protein